MNAVPKPFQCSLTVRLKTVHNLLAELKNQLAKRLGVIDVNEKSVIDALYFRAAKIMLYETTFPHTTGGYESHVIAIGDFFG